MRASFQRRIEGIKEREKRVYCEVMLCDVLREKIVRKGDKGTRIYEKNRKSKKREKENEKNYFQ